MNVGMMWFDNDTKTALAAKVSRAAEYYRLKYGRIPDICLVNPSMLAQQDAEPFQGQAGKIVVRAFRSILPGHLWIGVEDKMAAGAD